MKDDPKTIFGWCMYDWANSAYGTTVYTAIFVNYLASVTGSAWETSFLGFRLDTEGLHALAIGIIAFLTFLIAPVLGAISDYSAAKKKFLLFFAYMGSTATFLLYFTGTGDIALTIGLFVVAQTSFVAANVFYDGFLPDIASEGQMDRVSSRGYAFGYVGGGLHFALSLVLIALAQSGRLSISMEAAGRIAMASAALWWGGFTLFTVKHLGETGVRELLPETLRGLSRVVGFVSLGVGRTLRTTLRVGRFRHLVLFLVAFMFYNDGIQTVIALTASYALNEDGLGLTLAVVMLTLLVVQVVAIGGALLFSRLAGLVGAKAAVMISLVVWTAVVTYAYFIPRESPEHLYLLGGIAGLVLGGSQALSRSMYGSMIPAGASAEFYGFYSVFSKFSAIWGPLLFFALDLVTGSPQVAILSLTVFFGVGFVLLYFVDEEKARLASVEGAF